MIVLQVQKLKFVTIELDPVILEFKILCCHNFENDQRLKQSGLVDPRQGFL